MSDVATLQITKSVDLFEPFQVLVPAYETIPQEVYALTGAAIVIQFTPVGGGVAITASVANGLINVVSAENGVFSLSATPAQMTTWTEGWHTARCTITPASGASFIAFEGSAIVRN